MKAEPARRLARLPAVVMIAPIGAVTMLSGCASASRQAAGRGPVDLAGTWTLDREASDDFATVMGSRGTGMTVRGQGGAARVGRAGGGGAGGRAGGGGRMIDRQTIMRGLEELARPVERFTITQTDTAVTFAAADGRLVVLTTKGGRQRLPWFDGVHTMVRAEWKDGALRLERSRQDVHAVDTYARQPGSSRLVLITTVSGGMAGEVRLQRVYNMTSANLETEH